MATETLPSPSTSSPPLPPRKAAIISHAFARDGAVANPASDASNPPEKNSAQAQQATSAVPVAPRKATPATTNSTAQAEGTPITANNPRKNAPVAAKPSAPNGHIASNPAAPHASRATPLKRQRRATTSRETEEKLGLLQENRSLRAKQDELKDRCHELELKVKDIEAELVDKTRLLKMYRTNLVTFFENTVSREEKRRKLARARQAADIDMTDHRYPGTDSESYGHHANGSDWVDVNDAGPKHGRGESSGEYMHIGSPARPGSPSTKGPRARKETGEVDDDQPVMSSHSSDDYPLRGNNPAQGNRATFYSPGETGGETESSSGSDEVPSTRPALKSESLAIDGERGHARKRTRRRKPSVWTPKEEKMFMNAYNLHGCRWKSIQEMLPHKTRQQIQSHGSYLIKQGRLKKFNSRQWKRRPSEPHDIGEDDENQRGSNMMDIGSDSLSDREQENDMQHKEEQKDSSDDNEGFAQNGTTHSEQQTVLNDPKIVSNAKQESETKA